MPSSSPTDEFSYSRYGFHRNSGLHLTYKNYPEFFSIFIMENVLNFWINSETIFSVNTVPEIVNVSEQLWEKTHFEESSE